MAQQLSMERHLGGPPIRMWPPAPELLNMLMANRLQQAICVAAKLNIADLLKDGPREVRYLAEASGAHADALYRLLRVLAERGVFYELEPGTFAITRLSSLLRTDVPGSLRPVALWFGSVTYKMFGDLEYSVRTGEPSFDHVFGTEFFTYLQQHPDVGDLFNQVMMPQTSELALSLPRTYDFSGIGTLVDVGGGQGELIAAVLKAYPRMQGVLFDQPHVICEIDGYLQSAGVADRCQTVCGDISKKVPCGGDAYLLKSVIHGVSDELAVSWLRNCNRAMSGKGRLLLVEYVMPAGNKAHPSKLMDLLMLVGSHGGRERTEAEFKLLLTEAGFQLDRIVPADAFYSVIEGTPVSPAGSNPYP